ncbi:MAG: ferrous iron transport protein B [Clostridiales bacterium]|nr:ferrous iron transport protein B [Clostridiales bacterium]
MKHNKKVVLMGNPNVGKSTVFNEITGSHQHTGNWTGKTVDSAKGEYYYKFNDYTLVDLPGTYSLLSSSEEERIARDYLCFEKYDCVVCVVDSTSLMRNLILVLQVLEITSKVVLLLNLTDEAKKKNIEINTCKLQSLLGIPVISATARSGKGINALLEAVHLICTGAEEFSPNQMIYDESIEKILSNIREKTACVLHSDEHSRFFSMRMLENNDMFFESVRKYLGDKKASELKRIANNEIKYADIDTETYVQSLTESIVQKSDEIANDVVSTRVSKKEIREKILDRLLLGKYTGIPIMLIIFGGVLWLTIVGSNYPSELLRSVFDDFEIWLADFMTSLGVGETVVSLLVGGVLRVLLWVVAVMLPPMAIFFPLFSVLEDFGILPRIAFNMDFAFEKCGACGKQALTTCMGCGCNAVGVTGCRIIDSPRERLVAIITNSLTPCNGRFPLLIAIISMFFCSNSFLSALILLCFILVSIIMTFATSKVLTSTVLKGVGSSFVMELPAYRKPKLLKLIKDTVREKILFVLARAVLVAAPAGLIIWLLANINIYDVSLLNRIADVLDPIGGLLGLDGVMLLAFILGFPANEIVIPIALMAYLSTGEMTDYTSLESLKSIFVQNGWTWVTALCTCVFSMFHFPCSTTLLTIFKETKSIKWTLLSVITPLSVGIFMCMIINFISKVLNLI